MRITFVLSSIRLSGGVILVTELANRLASRGHSITLLTPNATIDAEMRSRLRNDVAVVEANVGLPTNPTPLSLSRLVIGLIRNSPPCDLIVATHTPTVIPVLLISWLKRQSRLWLYMDYPEMFRGRYIEGFLLRYAPRWFSDIAAISRPSAEEVIKQTRSKVHIMRPGIGLTHGVGGEIEGRSYPSGCRILYVGDDRPRKGLQEFVQAVIVVQSNHPNVIAVIVCKNTCDVDQQINCELHFRPDDAELASLYMACDLFVSTSWGEGLGYPALQAMAFGKPVVVTDSGGVRDYAVDGVNALVVPAQRSDAVANAILRLLGDDALRTRLSENAVRTASEYDWDRAADQFVAIASALT